MKKGAIKKHSFFSAVPPSPGSTFCDLEELHSAAKSNRKLDWSVKKKLRGRPGLLAFLVFTVWRPAKVGVFRALGGGCCLPKARNKRNNLKQSIKVNTLIDGENSYRFWSVFIVTMNFCSG